uniref:F-box protein AT5G49610-like beta-propeller domain-containing protein n=1 Tax=Oryza nivara TaxID=4536 RepID=A0A0E0G552_ORYNI
MAVGELGDGAASEGMARLSLSATVTAMAATATATATSSVFDNDDLLREILVRVTLPHCLVRASLVCKSWLRNASDLVFLRRFRSLHPPPTLGFYIDSSVLSCPRFVALQGHPPELGVLLGRASRHFDAWSDVPLSMWDSRNGRVLVEIYGKLAVHSPLLPPADISVYPQTPLKVWLDRSFTYNLHEFLPEDGGNGREYYRLALGYKCKCMIAYLFHLVDGIWVGRASDTISFPGPDEQAEPVIPLGVHAFGKLFLLTNFSIIIVLDCKTLELTKVNITDEIELEDCDEVDLCEGKLEDEDDILQASVTEAGESCAHVSILGIANAGKSAFLKLDDSIFLLDIVAKNMTKVYEICPEDGDIERIYPLLMIWPPKFPAHLTGNENSGRKMCTED